MFAKIAALITKKLTTKKTISIVNADLIAYGLEVGLAMIANILTTLLIGMIFSMVWESIVFLASYAPIRSFAGGYHARTHAKCYLTSNIIIIFALLLLAFIPSSLVTIFSLAVSLFSILVIVALAPVPDRNKPLEEIERKHYKKSLLWIITFEFLVEILTLANNYVRISMTISISLFIISMMLIIGKISSFYFDSNGYS